MRPIIMGDSRPVELAELTRWGSYAHTLDGILVLESSRLRYDQAFLARGFGSDEARVILVGEAAHFRWLLELQHQRNEARRWLEDLTEAWECEVRGLTRWQLEEEKLRLSITLPQSFVNLAMAADLDPHADHRGFASHDGTASSTTPNHEETGHP